MLPNEDKRINMASYNKVLQRQVQTQTNLVLHYDIQQSMQEIVNQVGADKLQNMRIVKLENGEEYLVATTTKDALFYQIVDGQCKKVAVKSKKKVDDKISVSDKVYTSRDSSALVAYLNTGLWADETDMLYELENGIMLTSYLSDGEQFAPVHPFGDSGNLIAEKRPCDEVYNIGNKTLVKMFAENEINICDETEGVRE